MSSRKSPISQSTKNLLISETLGLFNKHSDAHKSQSMSAYMKNHFDFFGIPTPLRRSLINSLWASWEPKSAAELFEVVVRLWEQSERECQYAAIDLLELKGRLLTLESVPLLLDLAIAKSWWDSVDALASVVGKLIRREKSGGELEAQAVMDIAVHDPHMWVRRIAMLHQLYWKQETDETRLFRYAKTLSIEREFFIEKAIAWALREYAKTNSKSVIGFLERMEGKLSSLTQREALRLLTKQSSIDKRT